MKCVYKLVIVTKRLIEALLMLNSDFRAPRECVVLKELTCFLANKNS